MFTPRFRVLVLNLFLVSLLLGFAAFAYFTGNPGSIYLEAAQELPVLGPLATKLRTAYLGPDPDGLAAPAGATGGDGDEVEVEYVLVGPDGREIRRGEPLDLRHLGDGESLTPPELAQQPGGADHGGGLGP